MRTLQLELVEDVLTRLEHFLALKNPKRALKTLVAFFSGVEWVEVGEADSANKHVFWERPPIRSDLSPSPSQAPGFSRNKEQEY
jgi:hypothetical protein